MIIGHEKNLTILEKTFKADKVPHAFLFWGPEKVGKRTVALEFAKSLICDKKIFLGCRACSACDFQSPVHQDSVIIRERFMEDTEKASIGIDDIVTIQSKMQETTLSGKPRVVIIDQTENVTLEAANRLLKTLEEPPPNSYFILITKSKDAILPTILSRTVPIHFSFVPLHVLEKFLDTYYAMIAKNERTSLARFAQGRPGLLLEALADPAIIKSAQKKYSIAFNLLANPLYASLQKTDELAAEKESFEEYATLLFFSLRSLFFTSQELEYPYRLKIPEAIVKQFSAKYSTLQYTALMQKLLASYKNMKETNASPRMALEGFLLEL